MSVNQKMQSHQPIEVSALEQIQKDLAGNRPVLAVIRSSKRDPKLEAAFIHLVQSLPPEISAGFSSQTGFAIEQGHLIQRQELKAVSRDWGASFAKEALMSLKSILEARGKIQPRIIVQKTHPTPAQQERFIEFLYVHLLKFYLLKDRDTARLSTIFIQQFRERLKRDLLPTREAILFFLMSPTRSAVDVEAGLILELTVESSPLVVAQTYNLFHPNQPVGIADVEQAVRRFPEMVKSVEREVFEGLNRGQKTKIESEGKEPQGSNVRSSSLKDLLQNLEISAAEVVSGKLIDLIRSVDSSDAQMRNINEALRNPRPQLRLLELAYALKQHQELTQKEIQSAVYAGLEEITNPLAPVGDMEPEEVVPAVTEAVEPSDAMMAGPSLRDSKSRIEKMKVDLQSPVSDFRLVIHNEREFFDLLKPGTGRFEAVEKDVEVLRQKFVRVFSYFNGTQKVLSGDGHFSISDHHIFDLKYGAYRFLMTKAQQSEDLVVLVVFDKSDGGNVRKENRFYDLARERRLRGGY